MKLRFALGICLLAFSLGCSSGGGGGGSNGTPAPKPLPGEDKATPLNIAQFGMPVDAIDINELVTPLGKVDKEKGIAYPGNVTSFDVSYKFNSGDNTIFQLFSSGADAGNDPNCEPELKNLILVSNAGSTEVLQGQRLTLTQQTPYLLTFKFAVNKECALLRTAAAVWIGKASEKPMTALKCFEIDGSPYILAANGSAFYGSEVNSKSGVFVSTNPAMFCGFPLPSTAKASCTTNQTGDDLGWSQVKCSAQYDSDTYSFNLSYDKQNQGAVFSCAKNASDMGQIEVRRCKQTLMDANVYFN